MNDRTRRIGAILYIVLTVAWMGLIFTQSLKSPERSARESGIVAEFLDPILDKAQISAEKREPFVRKLAHFTEFFIFGGLLVGAVRLKTTALWRYTVYPLFVSLATAVTDEYLQRFSRRGSSVADVLIDFSGAVVGILLLNTVLTWRQKRKEKASV